MNRHITLISKILALALFLPIWLFSVGDVFAMGIGLGTEQEVFLNIWLKAASYNSERGRPKAWVMSVAHHKIVDIIRSRRRNIAAAHPTDYETLESLPSSQRGTDEQAITNLEGERIRKALAILPPAQREVIDLAYFHGFSQSEIAQKLDQPLGTVKTRVRLAMQKLRVELEENVGD